MNRAFIYLFWVLAVVCLIAAFAAGRMDYIILASMCAAVSVAGRAEEAKDRERR